MKEVQHNINPYSVFKFYLTKITQLSPMLSKKAIAMLSEWEYVKTL